MPLRSSIVEKSLKHPRIVASLVVIATVLLGAMLPMVKVDTDPENMLSTSEPVRVFHNEMKREFALHDMVVLGVVNETDPDGVFNPESLRQIYELTEYARKLHGPSEEHPDLDGGVIEVDIIAPSTVDNIEQGALGDVKFEWLMRTPPATREEAIALREKARRIPFLNGTMISEDGRAICLYLPLTSKHLSYKVYSKLRKEIDKLTASKDAGNKYYITGLPVAEDTFGVEMFVQMAISAPMAMLVIFLLMLYFFRKFVLVISPMIVAMVSVICTMGLLIGTGHTVHIMSSLIPIFIMPIAVLDSIHILSEFFELYQRTRDRARTVVKVMDELFMPMLYTSLTSAAGFASLALTPIPPVQTFGLFVAFGVMLAWALTVTFIPAFVMFIPEKSLATFGSTHHEEDSKGTLLGRLLEASGRGTYRWARAVVVLTVAVVVVAGYGIGQIQVNDNPTRWFTKSHPIREADRVLNEHFGGTYMAYLVIEPEASEQNIDTLAGQAAARAKDRASELAEDLPGAAAVFGELQDLLRKQASGASSPAKWLDNVAAEVEKKFNAASDETYDAWDAASLFVDEESQRGQVFKNPAVLKYVARLQQYLQAPSHDAVVLVGKSNSIADIVKTVHRELLQGRDEDYRVPDSSRAVAECLIQYEGSHRPQDLWHFVSHDYRKTSLWLQLPSGDNRDMQKVVGAVAGFFKDNPPPVPLRHQWFGLTYINVIWQDKMVSGMLQAFIGSFLVVFLMMVILFRSALWGLLSMIPLTVTIGLIYGAIGLIGKDYDMPVAVLSSLTLGLAVDFAIHFLARSRVMQQRYGSWAEASGPMFGEPARAIARNVIVIAVGFLPLLAAPLVPYKTVGVFLATILAVAGAATLVILPALLRLLGPLLFPKTRLCCVTCHCGTCILSGVAAVALVVVNLHQFKSAGWTSLTWYSVPAVLFLSILCIIMSRREKCRADAAKEGANNENVD